MESGKNFLKLARKKLTWKSKRTMNLESQEKNEVVARMSSLPPSKRFLAMTHGRGTLAKYLNRHFTRKDMSIANWSVKRYSTLVINKEIKTIIYLLKWLIKTTKLLLR